MDLVGYLFDALDDDERRRIEQALNEDPSLRAQLDELRRSVMGPLSYDDDIEPPSSLAERTIEAVSEPVISANHRREWSPASSFRLVDVAVAGAVLLIASFVVLPSIASLRGDEGRLLCANQLRQIGVSLNSYQTIERGELPTGDPTGPLDNAGVFTLLLQARELLPEAKVLICPMADSAVVYVPRLTDYLSTPTDSMLHQLQRREMSGSFGYSLGHQVEGSHCGPAALGDKSAIVSDRPPREGEVQSSSNSPNHAGWGQNVLFADGHVQWHSKPQVGKDKIFTNDNGKVGAGTSKDDTCIGVSEAVPYPKS